MVRLSKSFLQIAFEEMGKTKDEFFSDEYKKWTNKTSIRETCRKARDRKLEEPSFHPSFGNMLKGSSGLRKGFAPYLDLY